MNKQLLTIQKIRNELNEIQGMIGNIAFKSIINNILDLLEQEADKALPQRKKIDLWEWLHNCDVHSRRETCLYKCNSSDVFKINILQHHNSFGEHTTDSVANILLTEFSNRTIETEGKPYFYEGEGLDE